MIGNSNGSFNHHFWNSKPILFFLVIFVSVFVVCRFSFNFFFFLYPFYCHRYRHWLSDMTSQSDRERSDGQGPSSTASRPVPALKRKRAKRSCDFCRKRKSKCDADTSIPCTNCLAVCLFHFWELLLVVHECFANA